jgi:hypothetical protein
MSPALITQNRGHHPTSFTFTLPELRARPSTLTLRNLRILLVDRDLYQATRLLDLGCEWVIGRSWRHSETEALLVFVTAQHSRLLLGNLLEPDTFVKHVTYDVTLGGDDGSA